MRNQSVTTMTASVLILNEFSAGIKQFLKPEKDQLLVKFFPFMVLKTCLGGKPFRSKT